MLELIFEAIHSAVGRISGVDREISISWKDSLGEYLGSVFHSQDEHL
jgi:hypothetical protein